MDFFERSCPGLAIRAAIVFFNRIQIVDRKSRSALPTSPVLRRMSGIATVFRVYVVRMLRSELDMRTSRDVCEISAHNGRVEVRMPTCCWSVSWTDPSVAIAFTRSESSCPTIILRAPVQEAF